MKINNFIFGQDEILTLGDPIYMAAKAPFRFTFRLENYKKAAILKGNDTVIKLLVCANKLRVESPFIKMGMF